MTTSSTTSGELAKPQPGIFAAGVGRRVARPDDGAITGVERVQDPGRAKRVDATAAEGRRRARTGAAIRLPEPGRVAVSPHRLAGGQVVARRRSRRRRAAPGCRRNCRGRRRTTSPVRSAGATVQPAATVTSRFRSARRERCRRAPVHESRASRRPSSLPSDRQRASSAPRPLGAEPVRRTPRLPERPCDGVGSSLAGAGAPRLGRRCGCRSGRRAAGGSSPAWARRRSSGVGVHRQWRSESAVAADAAGPQEREHSAREQDGGDHRRAPKSAGEATAGNRPRDQGRGSRPGWRRWEASSPSFRSRWTRERGAMSRPPRRPSGRSRPPAQTTAPG